MWGLFLQIKSTLAHRQNAIALGIEWSAFGAGTEKHV
jgi:hypothetical protein